MYLSDFEHLHPFWKYSPPKFEVVQNHARFDMFLAPKIFFEKGPEILDPYYFIKHTLHHCAKFCSDQPMELGDLMVRKKKNKCQQNKSPL